MSGSAIDFASMQNVVGIYPEDSLETVQFFSRQAPGSDLNYSPAYTLYQAKRWDAAASAIDPTLAKTMLEWRLWAADLAAAGAPNPKREDYVLDAAGISWYFTAVTTELLGAVFFCTAFKGRLPIGR